MCYEHEGWHAETLLYMLIQRAGTPGGTIAPRGFAPPSLENVHHLILPDKSSLTRPPPHALIQLHPGTFSIGHDDPEKLDLKTASLSEAETYEFGWDLEHPKRQVTIPKQVLVEKLCITNAEYLVYFRLFQESKGLRMPDNWVPSEPSTTTDSVEFQVRSLYGPVPFAAAAQWPFVGSYDEIEAFAAWKGGRIPTEIELRAFMDRHLGAESSLIGFKKWTFVPGLAPDPESNLRGHNGGVWEWSSSILDSHDGYEPSILYPGFSSDFHDNDHHVVLGGSFATIPRLAQRRTVRNFYQHNYRFAWIAGRVAYDV
ncbi:hypothetical protein DL93DRAFT_2071516 [Clavulina sp. PMI_390]|nr:hypothetical protein DL93DRAFT_2071516 [Clavulina sp. PMI_390]